MTINFSRNRVAKAAIAAGIVLGGYALAGTPASADVDTQIGQPQPAAASPAAPGIAFANSEEQQQEQYAAEQRAALIQRAQASDRHLQTLADQAEQRALYEHIDNEADARAEAAAEAAAVRERELQAQGSDQHLENLAEQGELTSSGEPACNSNPRQSTRPCAV